MTLNHLKFLPNGLLFNIILKKYYIQTVGYPYVSHSS
nr:MAG TPA: hypothetical protein [Caudoviricetes sp.]